ncbi:hypothetical protein CBER1_05012 [Cercospora berteroae]|uniref:Uncharacterized protein n=1 Tax=Cercospora berteroae TaxID=357750 RepID=A0A2S6BQV8_9PEZI|nr:hypothetical protein CBER1_05012 [Cercospora berteroae]
MGSASVQEGHVVRVTSRVQLPTGLKFIGVEEPVAILQYARDMSLARGRIVYEIFGQERKLTGYVVPSDIHTEAVRNCRKGNDARIAWAGLSETLRTAHWDVRRKILDQFPNIDATAARLISERLISHKTHINKPNIEKAVVDHVIHMWTAFSFRLEQGESKESAIKTINPRTREVLTKWMGPDARAEKIGDFWKRWDLLDTPVPTQNVWGEELVYKEMDYGGKRRWGAEEELGTFYTPGAMTWFGGKETAANLACRSNGFT